MKFLLLLLSTFFITPFALAAKADHTSHHDHKSHMGMDFVEPHELHHQNAAGTRTPSDQAYIHINHVMHEAMNIDFTGDPDIDFLRGMIPHHQGAVDMAKVQLKYGQDGVLKNFTKRVIREQEREIRFMKINLGTLEAERKRGPHHQHKSAVTDYKRVNKLMHQAMNITLTGQADRDFVSGMIPHHQGAVDMAKVVIQHGKDSNTRRLAYDIINVQESEITWLKQWQARQRLMQNR